MSGENIEYDTKNGTDAIQGYISKPDDGKKHSGIIVIHEIFGLDEHTKNVADRISKMGYIALAPDLFSSRELSSKITKEGIKKTMDFIMSIPPEMQRDENYRKEKLDKMDKETRNIIMGTYETLLVHRPVKLLTDYLSSGVDYLKSLPDVDKIGSVGFCFGGGMSLSLGCTGKVDATAVFYGENPKDMDSVQNVKSFLGLYAGEDKRITSKVPDLLEKLYEYNKPVTLKIYSGAYHAFFNDTRPQIYNQKAAKDAWNMLMNFFKENI